MKKDYFSLALKNLRHKGLRSWLTILGIFIGIAAVVALISLGNGLREAITGQFSALDVDKLIIQNSGTGFGPPGSTAVKKLNEHDLELINSVNGVKIAISRLLRIAKIEYGNELKYTYLGSMPENKKQLEVIYDSFNVDVEKGRILNENDGGKVLLGSDVAERFDKKIESGSRLKINGEEFEVIGVLEKSSNFQINQVILMIEKDMKELLDIDNEIDMIVVQVESKDRINEVAKNIELKIRKDRKLKEGEDDFSVQTPTQAISSVNTILDIINLIVTGIAAISLIVGGIGIANTMYTSVLERTREIGVMKAIGAKNSDILWIFLIESGLLGFVGGVMGALLGLGLAFLVTMIANSAFSGLNFKINLDWILLFGSVAFAFFVGVISGVLPALQASKLKPVEALRK